MFNNTTRKKIKVLRCVAIGIWGGKMRLGDYIRGLPRGQRQNFRAQLASAHNRSIALIRKWEHWPPPPEWTKEQVSQMACRHPGDIESVGITEQLTGFEVTRRDLRPEIWGEVDG